jgi:hypothetical protein
MMKIVLLFFACLSIQAVQAQDLSNEDFVGIPPAFEDRPAPVPCITEKEYLQIESQCNANAVALGLYHPNKVSAPPQLEWPLRKAAGFADCGYHFIGAYVDQNTASGSVKDYNCNANTYDGHHGTDIAVWPFGFYKMDSSQVEIIAAAAGTIIDKHDGEFDRNCSVNNLTANYVVVQHADGSRALYWHMKKNSVTSKSIGSAVVAGDYLGVTGSSGSASGPHLHFEVWSGSTAATYVDPYSGTCNLLNANSWWKSQKPHAEPSVLKASVHTTDITIPSCPATGNLNESTSYVIPFQGVGLAPGYAKFYIFVRESVSGSNVSLSILNPDNSVFNSWTYTLTSNTKTMYYGFSKKLPTISGNYTFQATYNGISCSQVFQILNPTNTMEADPFSQLDVYPSPVAAIMNISAKGMSRGKYTLTLKNSLGQLLYTDHVLIETDEFLKSISMSTYPAGIYFLGIKGDKKSIVRKVLKEN